MSKPTPPQQWSGEMLDRPEMVEAFTMQLRRVLSDHAEYVARIRRDAEAMWAENPPEGYSTFEAWWRHRWVVGPFADIQKHLEAAAALTFRLEARHRRARHEIPAVRQAAAAGRQTPALGSGAAGAPRRPESAPPLPKSEQSAQPTFMDMVRKERRSA